MLAVLMLFGASVAAAQSDCYYIPSIVVESGVMASGDGMVRVRSHYEHGRIMGAVVDAPGWRSEMTETSHSGDALLAIWTGPIGRLPYEVPIRVVFRNVCDREMKSEKRTARFHSRE